MVKGLEKNNKEIGRTCYLAVLTRTSLAEIHDKEIGSLIYMPGAKEALGNASLARTSTYKKALAGHLRRMLTTADCLILSPRWHIAQSGQLGVPDPWLPQAPPKRLQGLR